MNLIKTNKDYALLFFGSLVSEIGNSLYSFAISLYILTRTGSSAQMGIFLAVSVGVRLLFSPLAGVLVDRLNRIKIIYYSDFIRAALFLFAAICMLFNEDLSFMLVLLYSITVFSSITAAFFSPAISSSVPEISGEKDLHQANSGLSIIQSIQSIFGILLGAIIYSFFGLFWILILNALSFFASAISEMLIHPKYKKETVQLSDQEHSFSEGIAYIKQKKGVFELLLLVLFLNFAITPLVGIGLPYLFNNVLLRSPMELATLEIVFSVATLFTGFVIGNQVIRSSNITVKKNILFTTLIFIVISLLIYLVTKNYLGYWYFFGLILLAYSAIGVTIIYVNIPIQTGMTIAIQPEYRGRVFSITGSLSQLAVPIAFLMGGYITENFSVAALALVCSALILVPSIFFVLSKNVSRLFHDIDEISKNARENS